MLPEGNPERRAYALEGRMEAMGEVLAACAASFSEIDVDGTAEEIALAYARAHQNFADWLGVALIEAESERQSIFGGDGAQPPDDGS